MRLKECLRVIVNELAFYKLVGSCGCFGIWILNFEVV